MIITQMGVPDDEQQPVIVFERQMGWFMRVLERASKAVLTSVPEVEDAATRKERKKVKANPPEFRNTGKRWTRADDEVLSEQFEKGASMETLTKLLKRRSGAIEVRLYKLGLLSPGE